jgi:hypothetical protein
MLNQQLNQSRNRPLNQQPARGFALVMVLVVVATASVLAWAILASAQLHSQVNTNTVTAVQARYTAESGASLAMHYLLNPDDIPAGSQSIVAGGRTYFGGHNDLDPFGDGSRVQVSVESLGNNMFRIHSRAKAVEGEDVLGAATEVRVRLSGGVPRVKHAVATFANMTLPLNMTVSGPIASLGRITAPHLPASNIASNITRSEFLRDGAAAPLTDSVPLIARLALSLNPTSRPYTFNDQNATAVVVPANTSITTANASTLFCSNNPGRVLVTTGQITLTDVNFNGTIVHLGLTSSVRLVGNVSITPEPGMPAIVTLGDLDLRGTSTRPPRVTLNGLTLVSDDVLGDGRTNTQLTINGSLMMTGLSPAIDNFRGPIAVNLPAGGLPADPTVSTASTVPSKIEILDWRVVE